MHSRLQLCSPLLVAWSVFAWSVLSLVRDFVLSSGAGARPTSGREMDVVLLPAARCPAHHTPTA